jgi:hypothetical protein
VTSRAFIIPNLAEAGSAELCAFQHYSAVLNIGTSTLILTSKHKIPWTEEEPQTNAKNAYVCATRWKKKVPDTFSFSPT